MSLDYFNKLPVFVPILHCAGLVLHHLLSCRLSSSYNNDKHLF